MRCKDNCICIAWMHKRCTKICIAWMHCKSIWIKASAKCINVNVNVIARKVRIASLYHAILRKTKKVTQWLKSDLISLNCNVSSHNSEKKVRIVRCKLAITRKKSKFWDKKSQLPFIYSNSNVYHTEFTHWTYLCLYACLKTTEENP